MRQINNNGYYVVETDKGFELEHRLIYFNKYPKDSKRLHIHHIDHNKLNNSIENLIGLPEYIHIMVHKESYRIGRPLTRQEIQEFVKNIKIKKYSQGYSNSPKKKKYKTKPARIYNWLKRKSNK